MKQDDLINLYNQTHNCVQMARCFIYNNDKETLNKLLLNFANTLAIIFDDDLDLINSYFENVINILITCKNHPSDEMIKNRVYTFIMNNY